MRKAEAYASGFVCLNALSGLRGFRTGPVKLLGEAISMS